MPRILAFYFEIFDLWTHFSWEGGAKKLRREKKNRIPWEAEEALENLAPFLSFLTLSLNETLRNTLNIHTKSAPLSEADLDNAETEAKTDSLEISLNESTFGKCSLCLSRLWWLLLNSSRILQLEDRRIDEKNISEYKTHYLARYFSLEKYLMRQLRSYESSFITNLCTIGRANASYRNEQQLSKLYRKNYEHVTE